MTALLPIPEPLGSLFETVVSNNPGSVTDCPEAYRYSHTSPVRSRYQILLELGTYLYSTCCTAALMRGIICIYNVLCFHNT